MLIINGKQLNAPENWSCWWTSTFLIACSELTTTALWVPNKVKLTISPYSSFHWVYVRCGRSALILCITPRNGRDHGPGGSLLGVTKVMMFNCYTTVQHNTIQHNTTQHNTAQHNTAQHNTTQYSTIQYITIQYNTSQYNTTQYSTTQHNTIHHNTTQHNTAQHSTIQHNTIQHNTAEHSTIQYSAIQHNTIQHNTAQHNTIQHNTAEHNTIQHPPQHNTTQCSTIQHNTSQYNTTQVTTQHNTKQHTIHKTQQTTIKQANTKVHKDCKDLSKNSQVTPSSSLLSYKNCQRMCKSTYMMRYICFAIQYAVTVAAKIISQVKSMAE